jgi:oligopeptide transport system permease protein
MVVSYVIRRLLWLLPVLFVVSIITFILMHAVPGGPWASEKHVSAGAQAALNARYGLDKSIFQQYLIWLVGDLAGGVQGTGGILRLDFGPSYRYIGRTVNSILLDGAPKTIQLGIQAFILSVVVGIPLGIVAALNHNRWPDYLATGVSMLGIATPSFVLAVLLILIFSVWLKVLPPLGWKGPDTWVLPTIALAGYQIAQISRYTRASMLEVTRKDYIRTAQSKGIVPRLVVVRHMVRNALIPVVTILGPILANLVTGSFIIEYFFGVPGIGRNFVVSIGNRDYAMIMAVTVIYAATVALLNVVVDVLYGYIDPRIRYS